MPSVLEPSAAKASSFSASGRICSAKFAFNFSNASAVPCIRIASRGMSSLNVASRSAVVRGSAAAPLTTSFWARSYILYMTESISDARRSHWNCSSMNASCRAALTWAFTARRSLNLPSSAESVCCASIAAFTALAAAFMPQKLLLQTVSPVFLSCISAMASSRPENLSSALSLAAAFSARLSSLEASLSLSTPLSTSDLPTVLTFVAASAATDLPAAFSSSTSSCRTTSLASLLSGGRGSSSGAMIGAGCGWFALAVFWTFGPIAGLKSTFTLLSPLNELIPPMVWSSINRLFESRNCAMPRVHSHIIHESRGESYRRGRPDRAPRGRAALR